MWVWYATPYQMANKVGFGLWVLLSLPSGRSRPRRVTGTVAQSQPFPLTVHDAQLQVQACENEDGSIHPPGSALSNLQVGDEVPGHVAASSEGLVRALVLLSHAWMMVCFEFAAWTVSMVAETKWGGMLNGGMCTEYTKYLQVDLGLRSRSLS